MTEEQRMEAEQYEEEKKLNEKAARQIEVDAARHLRSQSFFFPEPYKGQEADEVLRDNFEASAASHRYDE